MNLWRSYSFKNVQQKAVVSGEGIQCNNSNCIACTTQKAKLYYNNLPFRPHCLDRTVPYTLEFTYLHIPTAIPLFPGFLPRNTTSVALCLQRRAAGSEPRCRLTSSTVKSSGSGSLQGSGNFSHNIPKPALDGDVRPPVTSARVLERRDTVWYSRPSVEIRNIKSNH